MDESHFSGFVVAVATLDNAARDFDLPEDFIGIISANLLPLYVFQDRKTYWLGGVLLLFSHILFRVSFLLRGDLSGYEKNHRTVVESAAAGGRGFCHLSIHAGAPG